VGEGLSGWQRSVEEDVPAVEPAHVDTHGTRVDPDHAGHCCILVQAKRRYHGHGKRTDDTEILFEKP
jgi:hypothetical protein